MNAQANNCIAVDARGCGKVDNPYSTVPPGCRLRCPRGMAATAGTTVGPALFFVLVFVTLLLVALIGAVIATPTAAHLLPGTVPSLFQQKEVHTKPGSVQFLACPRVG